MLIKSKSTLNRKSAALTSERVCFFEGSFWVFHEFYYNSLEISACLLFFYGKLGLTCWLFFGVLLGPKNCRDWNEPGIWVRDHELTR